MADETLDGAALLAWLLDLAADEAAEQEGERGVRRVVFAEHALERLARGRPISLAERTDVLYALRRAGEAAAWFGEAGRDGFRAARALVARLVSRRASARGSAARNVETGRAVYWAGKAVATFYGLGGAYDAAYEVVRRRPGMRVRLRKRPLDVELGAGVTEPRTRSEAAAVEVRVEARPSELESGAPESPVAAEAVGTLDEVEQKGA